MMVKVVTRSGTEISLQEWQQMYGLEVGGNQIGRHFSYVTDPKLAQDLRDYGILVVNELLIRVLDAFREALGTSVIINSFNRSPEKQEKLTKAGYRTAQQSPHVVFMAADINTSNADETKAWVKILQSVARNLGIKIRIGYEDYLKAGQHFIHVDVCPEFYAKGKPFYSQTHPVAWELAITW